MRKLGVAELKVVVAPLGNFFRIVDRFRNLGKEGSHFLLALEVELVRFKAHPGFLAHRLIELDAQKDVLNPAVLFG